MYLNFTVWGLAIGSALLVSGNILLIAITALIGVDIAPKQSMATLPVALQFIGTLAITLPAALLVKRLGRKRVFLFANIIGVSGTAIAYFVLQLGCLLLLVCLLINQFDQSYWVFFSALIFLGIGWNFTFIGATHLLTQTYTNAEKEKVQGFNDLLIFSGAAFGGLMAGYFQEALGWSLLNLLMAPIVLGAMITLFACYYFDKSTKSG